AITRDRTLRPMRAMRIDLGRLALSRVSGPGVFAAWRAAGVLAAGPLRTTWGRGARRVGPRSSLSCELRARPRRGSARTIPARERSAAHRPGPVSPRDLRRRVPGPRVVRGLVHNRPAAGLRARWLCGSCFLPLIVL